MTEHATVGVGVGCWKFHAGLTVAVLAEFFGGFFTVLFEYLMELLMGVVHGEMGGGFVGCSPEDGNHNKPEDNHDNVTFAH